MSAMVTVGTGSTIVVSVILPLSVQNELRMHSARQDASNTALLLFLTRYTVQVVLQSTSIRVVILGFYLFWYRSILNVFVKFVP